MVRRSPRGLVRLARFVQLGALAAAVAIVWPHGVAARQAAKQDGLPTARQIIDKYIDAMGGSIAFKATNSMRARGTMMITGQQITGQIEMLASRPNKLLTRITVTGMGPFEEGYDGKVAWSIDPLNGPALITGKGLIEHADEAWFDAPLHAADHVKEMTVLGKETFDNREVYRLKVVTNRGTEQIEFFETSSGMHAGTEATRETPMGNVPTTTAYREFQRFGQLTFPSKMVNRVLGQEHVVVFTAYEFNNVPASVFELPPPIKALIK